MIVNAAGMNVPQIISEISQVISTFASGYGDQGTIFYKERLVLNFGGWHNFTPDVGHQISYNVAFVKKRKNTAFVNANR
jgi:hypothetical protein